MLTPGVCSLRQQQWLAGPAANSVKPADKPKNVKPQAVPVAPVEAVASAVHTTAHQLPAPVGSPPNHTRKPVHTMLLANVTAFCCLSPVGSHQHVLHMQSLACIQVPDEHTQSYDTSSFPSTHLTSALPLYQAFSNLQQELETV